MVRTDTFIRERKLSNDDVARINYIIKARARRYIAAGKSEWLYPEKMISENWKDLRKTLLPPEGSLFGFGGELYVQYKDGRVHYQDAFGRTEKESDFLKKAPPDKPLRSRAPCGCGSGRPFDTCCKPKPLALRSTWNEYSIRERNLMLFNAIIRVLKLNPNKDWVSVRRELTDDQISKIYSLYRGLWPFETDLLSMLPKPDGVPRAVYTGAVHPKAIVEFALGASLYFGELIIQHPFLNAATVKKEFSPVENPRSFRQEFLKAVLLFLNVMPLVERGLVNLVPDPCDFDVHLRDQMMDMAKGRFKEITFGPGDEPRLDKLMKEDMKRSLMSLSPEATRFQLRQAFPNMSEAELGETLQDIEHLKERDPLAVLQDSASDSGKEGGLLTTSKLIPNFEMSMYLAQATGSCIVTDSRLRWQEVQRVIYRHARAAPHLPRLASSIGESTFAFPQDVARIIMLSCEGSVARYSALMRDVFKYLSRVDDVGSKPNVEERLNAQFLRAHSAAQSTIRSSRLHLSEGRISCAFPAGGIQDNNVNRLLLMSSSDAHLQSVPMAFFIEGLASLPATPNSARKQSAQFGAYAIGTRGAH